MIIDFNTISASSRYHLLTQTIMPRPIAWVLSVNDDESLNLAPFSFFNALCSDPALMVLSIGYKDDGNIKDTGRNMLSGRDFVIHIANVEQAEHVNNSAAGLEYGDSEVTANKLSLTDFPDCPLPRLKDCHIAYHCKLYDSHTLGPNKQNILYAEVLLLYLDDAVAEQQGKRIVVDANKVNPLSRLGGAQFGSLDDSFSLKRPS